MTDYPLPLMPSTNTYENNSYNNNNISEETKTDYNKNESETYLIYRTSIAYPLWLIASFLFIVGTAVSIIGIIFQVYECFLGLIFTVFTIFAAYCEPLFIRVTIDKKREIVTKSIVKILCCFNKHEIYLFSDIKDVLLQRTDSNVFFSINLSLYDERIIHVINMNMNEINNVFYSFREVFPHEIKIINELEY